MARSSITATDHLPHRKGSSQTTPKIQTHLNDNRQKSLHTRNQVKLEILPHLAANWVKNPKPKSHYDNRICLLLHHRLLCMQRSLVNAPRLKESLSRPPQVALVQINMTTVKKLKLSSSRKLENFSDFPPLGYRNYSTITKHRWLNELVRHQPCTNCRCNQDWKASLSLNLRRASHETKMMQVWYSIWMRATRPCRHNRLWRASCQRCGTPSFLRRAAQQSTWWRLSQSWKRVTKKKLKSVLR